MANIMVLGGLGFIGSHLVDRLIDAGETVIVLDAMKTGSNIKNCNSKARYIFEDLVDFRWDDFFFNNNVDEIYHLAAESHVDRAIKDPQPFIDSNITGTYRLFHALTKELGGRSRGMMYELPGTDPRKIKVLLFSTDEVMGELATGSFKEDDPTLPKNMYSMTKQAQEGIARSYYHSDNVQVITTRCSNIYGPRQNKEKLLPTIIRNAKFDNKIPVYGDGQQVREWTHVSDAVDGAIFAMENGNINETYHIGSAIEKVNLDVVEFVLKEMGKPESLINYVTDRKGHDKRYALSVDKMNKMGWKAKVGFEDGIKETIEWYKKNPRWGF